jgi:hypothetical protein
MDRVTDDSIRQEIEERARALFAGSLRRVEWPRHDDEPWIEPGELVPILVLTAPPGRRRGRFEPGQALKAIRDASGQPVAKAFRQELVQRVPGVRHLGFRFEDEDGRRHRGGMIIAVEDHDKHADDGVTPVMVRLKAPELDIVDTLISAGIANNRAEALRWALARISERPAYARLREHTREIEALKTEF